MARKGIRKYIELGLDPEMPYFNSGVMVLNLDAWREQNISNQAFEYIRTYHAYMNFHDQEALNVVLRGRWGELDPRWNVSSAIYNIDMWPDSEFKQFIKPQLTDLLNDSHITHFTGRSKPWRFEGMHPENGLFFLLLKKIEDAFTNEVEVNS